MILILFGPITANRTTEVRRKTHSTGKAPKPTPARQKKQCRQTTTPDLTLALADTDGTATATGGLGVLTTDTETPVVTETTVGADTLQALEILTDLAIDTVGDHVVVLAIADVALSVQEPGGDLVLKGVLEDGDEALEFFGREFTGAVILLVVLALSTCFPRIR